MLGLQPLGYAFPVGATSVERHISGAKAWEFGDPGMSGLKPGPISGTTAGADFQMRLPCKGCGGSTEAQGEERRYAYRAKRCLKKWPMALKGLCEACLAGSAGGVSGRAVEGGGAVGSKVMVLEI